MTPPDPRVPTSSSGSNPASPEADYALLMATTRKILEEKDLSRVLQTVCEEACRVLGAERSQIVQISPNDSSERKILYAHNIPQDFIDALKASREKSILLDVLREKRLKVFTDIKNESHVFDPETLQRMGLQVVCAIPILVEEKAFGALVLYHLTPKEYTTKDLRLAEAFGDLASIAIEKAQLSQKDKERATRLEIVDQIAKAVSSTLEPEALFQTIAREIRRVVPCDRCVIASLNPSDMSFHVWHRASDIPADPFNLKNSREFTEWMLQQVYESKQPKYFRNICEIDLPWLSSRAKVGIRSYLYIPVIQNNKSIAHLSLSSTEVDAFSAGDVELLASIAGHLGSAIRNVTLYRTAQERAKRLEIAGNIARAVSSTLEPEELFQTVTQEIRRAIPFDRCIIANAQPGKQVIWWAKTDIELVPLATKFAGKIPGWVQNVYEKNESVNISDIRNHPSNEAQHLAEAGIRSLLVTPILQDGRCIAHLALNSTILNAYTAEHEEFLTSISSHLGPAIRNVSLLKAAEDRAARLAVLNELSRKIAENLDLKEIIESIARASAELTQADKSRVFLFDEATEMFSLSASYGRIPDEGLISLKPGQGITGTAGKTGEAIIIPDIQSDSRWNNSEWAKRYDVHSYIALPIHLHGKPVLTIICFSHISNFFGDEDLELLGAFASQAAIAIEKSRLIKNTREHAMRQEVTARIAKAIGSTLEPEALFRLIVSEIRRAVPCDRCTFSAIDVSKKSMTSRCIESDVEVEARVYPEFIDWVSKEVYISGKPVNIRNLEEIDSEWAIARAKSGLRSLITVPILQDNQCIAHFALSSIKPGGFSAEDEKLLTAIAGHLGPALQNARLYEESKEKGRRLSALVGATNQLTQGLDLVTVLNAIVEAAGTLFDGEARLRLPKGGELVLVASTPGAQVREGNESLPIEGSFAGKVFSGGVPLNSNDLNSDSRSTTYLRPENIAATLGIPVKREGQTIGTLHILREKGYQFDEEAIEIAKSFADQAAVAIENARLHEEANKSLEFFRSVVDDNADAVLLQDRKGRIIHWNKGAEKLYGFTEAEALGKDIDIIFPREENVIKKGSIVFEKGISQYFETDRVRKDGTRVPVSITISPVKNQDGKVVAISAIHKDLSDVKQAEAALRKSEERIRAVMESAADCIFTIDENGIVESVNPAAEKLFGYPGDEIIGQNVKMLMGEPDRRQHDGYLKKYLESGQGKIIGIGTREVVGHRKDGGTVPLDLTVSETSIGGRRLFIGMMRDATERKRVEEEIKSARDEAEAASRAKSEFLSTMSHELRSPLNAVIGFSDLLLRDADENDELTQRLVPKIRDSGVYLLSMIEEMLDLDRIAEGKVRLKLKPTPLNDLIFRVVDSWHPRLPEGFSLSLQLDHACGVIGCDSTRITQILNNLIDNAVKYSPTGGTILVRTLASSDDIQVSVRDEGMGISPEEKKIIFDRFAQLESGYTRRAGGLGIGLALAREIMDIHGGRISVDSEEGVGSTFTITLPRIQVTNHGNSGQPGGDGKPDQTDEPWAGRTILVVDDVENYHEYLKLLMKSAARVESAYNGEEALEAAVRVRPDMILMDLRMPVMDGFEAISHLKSDPQTKDIPILAVTAQAMSVDKEDSLRAGADGFVTKPIDAGLLVNEMRRHFGARV